MSAKKTQTDNTPVFVKTEVVHCAVKLTEEEIKEKVDSLVEAIIEKEDIAEKKKIAVEEFNDSIKRRDDYSRELAHILDKGTEMRDVECELHINHSQKIRLYLHPKTKEIMKECEATDEDLQMLLGE